MTDTPLTQARVDLDALIANIRLLSDRVKPADFMMVVKADAYGHGAVRVARAAYDAGLRNIGALDIPNARAVRAAVGADCTVLSWLYMADEDFSDAIDDGIELTASTLRELRRMADAPAHRTPSVQFKIDTGLNRNGATAEQWPELMREASRLQRDGRIEITGVWTHIAEASEEEDSLSMSRFDRAVAVAADYDVRFPVRHLAASSAAFRRDDVRYDMVRVGGHCWGIPSFDGVTPQEMGLTPVMTLTSTVAAMVVRNGRTLAQLPLGYLDGLPREAQGRVDVAVRGIRLALDREIAPTSTIIDVTGTDVTVGDTVYLFGTGDHGEQTVRAWGDLTGTLGDEIVARVGRRVPRVYTP